MNRRAFFGALGLLAAPVAAWAQPAGKVWRIGYLSLPTPELDRRWVAAFQQGLRELGYMEGRDVIIEQRHASGRRERLAALATELVGLKVDVIVTYGGAPEARKASSTVPIVMTVSADPVGSGLVASLARPGGTVTGLSDVHGDTIAKRLELLKEATPSAARVAVLSSPGNLLAPRQLQDLRAAAQILGITVVPFELRGPGDLDRAITAIGKARVDALFLIPDSTFGNHARFADLVNKQRLPAIGTVREFADAGLLMSYGTSFAELWRRAATYVDKIFKGADPGDLPIEQARQWELVINRKTAKALGLTIPPSLLQRADQVIE